MGKAFPTKGAFCKTRLVKLESVLVSNPNAEKAHHHNLSSLRDLAGTWVFVGLEG